MFPDKSDVIVKGKRAGSAPGKEQMKDRTRQRINRRIKEQMLDLRNECGVNDPTPYEAVREIVNELRKRSERGKKKHGTCTGFDRV